MLTTTDFRSYSGKNVSPFSLFIAALTLSIVPFVLVLFRSKQFGPLGLSSVILSFVAAAFAWILLLIAICRSGLQWKWMRYMRILTVLFTTVSSSLLLIQACLSRHTSVIVDGSIYTEDDAELPQTEFILALITPILISAVFKASKIHLTLLSWATVVVVVIVLIMQYNYFVSMNGLVLYIPCSLLLIYENYRQDFDAFRLINKFTGVVKENEMLSAESRAADLRHMIGNVAQDLKTPLSGFTAGVDVLVETANGPLDKEDLCLLRNTIQDIRNINNFMHMTINRCIDYTKTSKGIELVPRMELARVSGTLQLPIECIRAMQQRVHIVVEQAKELDQYLLMTDQQWLRENILCLLSNAVKFSVHGVVTLRLSLVESLDLVSKKRQLEWQRFEQENEAEAALHRDDAPGVLSPKKSNPNILRVKKAPAAAATAGGKYMEALSHLFDHRAHQVVPGDHDVKSLTSAGSVHKSAPALMVEVEDYGVGLDADKLQKIFQPLRQTQRRTGGTGLGLHSLSRRVSALRGMYGAEPRSDGEEGSVFWFVVPGLQVNEELELISLETASQKVLDAIIVPAASTDDVVQLTNIKSSFLRAHTTGSHSGFSCLTVDDSPTIQKMTQMILRRQGFLVDQVENGANALECIFGRLREGKCYDVVLMDLQMPVMDGYEATRRIRDKEKSDFAQYGVKRHQFILGLSANNDRDSINEAFRCGVDDFIHKPFSFAAFTTAYDKFLSAQQSAEY